MSMTITPTYKRVLVTGGSRLPSAYQEVEYLQSSGTQYIDTGVVPHLNDVYDAKYEINAISTYGTIFGSLVSGSYGSVYRIHEYSINLQLQNCQYEEDSIDKPTSFSLNQSYSVKLKSTNETSQESIPLSLFAMKYKRSGSQTVEVGYNAKAKMYHFKAYRNSTLVRNLIPCYRKADSVAGMYDLVNSVFYTNSGTGTFIVGPDVSSLVITPCYKTVYVVGGSRLPSAYQEVEYLQSSGTQYIDTGFVPKYDAIRVVFDGFSTSSSSLFGSAAGKFGITGSGGVFRYDYIDQHFSSSVRIGTRGLFEINKNEAYFNGNLINTFSLSTSKDTKSLRVFARNTGDEMTGRCYSFKMWNNDELIRNLIPCYRKSDSVAGMYDLVNGTFYENAGSGSFIVGPDINALTTVTTRQTNFVN